MTGVLVRKVRSFLIFEFRKAWRIAGVVADDRLGQLRPGVRVLTLHEVVLRDGRLLVLRSVHVAAEQGL